MSGVTLLMLVTMVLAASPVMDKSAVPLSDPIGSTEHRITRTSGEQRLAQSLRTRRDVARFQTRPGAIAPSEWPAATETAMPRICAARADQSDRSAGILLREAILALPPPRLA